MFPRIKKRLLGGGLLAALVATVALAAASSDRLRDTVLIGSGTATTKTLTFDVGSGASNPYVYGTTGNAVELSSPAVVGSGEASGTPGAGTLRGPAATGTNTAGANLTFDASNGTGSGGSGKILFRIAPVAVSSSTPNTLSVIETLKNDGTVVFGAGDGTASPLTGLLSGASGAGSNVSGPNLQLQAGNGTGSGGSGKIIFKIGAAGVSGSTANTLTTIETLKNDGTVVIGDGDGTAAPASALVSGASGTGTNVAGPNMVVSAGNGTGNGGSGKIIFETAPVAASGSTANTYATRLTFDNTGEAIFGDQDQTSTPRNANLFAANGAGANVTGASMNISAGDGTGNGGSGKIIFNIAAAGASSSTPNSYDAILTLRNDGVVVVGKGDGTSGAGNGLVATAAGSGANFGGRDLFLQAGNGTGNAGSGSVKIQTAPGSTSGSTANNLTTVMEVKNTGGVQITGTGGNTPHNCTRDTTVCSSVTSCAETCGAGKIAVGGGCSQGAGLVSLVDSYPSAAAVWQCIWTSAPASTTAYAICCDI